MSADRRLRPREHGAYAMLAFPCVSGLVLGGPSVPGMAAVTAAVSAFLAHESALVLLGARGARIHAAHSDEARRRLVFLGAVALLAALLFAGTAPPEAWPPAAAAAVLAAGVAGLLVAGRTRSVAGELVVGAAFASVHGVVAGAGGAGRDVAYLPVLVWAASFGLATLSVHALKYRFKARGAGRWTVYGAPAFAAAAAVAPVPALLSGRPEGAVLVALLPKALLVLALSAITVHPRHLKRVGWSLVAADALTFAVLAWALGWS